VKHSALEVWGGDRASRTVWLKVAARSRKSSSDRARVGDLNAAPEMKQEA
jgi:hypothetical protein